MSNRMHAATWDAQLLNAQRTKRFGVSSDVLAKVLVRAMVQAPEDISRADIAGGAMLARPTTVNPAIVSKAVAALIDMDVLVEGALRPDEKRTGRPVKPLRLDGDTWGLAGITVEHNDDKPVALTGLITSLRADIDRDVLVEHTVELRDASFFDLAHHIHQLIEHLQQELNTIEGRPKGQARQLMGIGIQVAAPVHQGKILGGTHIGIPAGEDYDLATPLQDLTGIPVVVDNDVNLLAVRELYRSEYKERDLAIVAVLQDGVGAALILDGHVYRGGGGMAGEPGHHQVLPLPLPPTLDEESLRHSLSVGACHCGKENHVDCFAVPVRLRSALDQPFKDAARVRSRDENSELTEAGWIFRRGGNALGQGLATIINSVNPSRIVMMMRKELASVARGDQSAAAEYIDAMEEAVDEYSFNRGAHNARAGANMLTRVTLDPQQTPRIGALCAALRVLDSFVLHARGRDECGNA
ncbi:ROK family protein [Pseudarthrobacter oxydans]|uniref:ROK family protein n=1 Tax=Pseudarthrobacter oxydans TaxID=1671 RepID=UPI00157352F7|nr:ROK family protein [Pseudarthrobacter oxydans]NSX38642.1 ROK family protein [Pseudarthrobacter oxydans]